MSLRADGRKNRQRILDTAEAIFAEQGFDASLEHIATQAGVSRMTLYRHFKDRETLCIAVLERNVAELELRVEALQDDPYACVEIMNMMVELFAHNQGMVEGLTRHPTHQNDIDRLRHRVVDLLVDPLSRAQTAGLIKTDIRREDLFLVMSMLGAAVGHGSLQTRTEHVRRALSILQFGFMCPTDEK
ncbi:TetR/AcrR family transcriptional regulator [Celeribacter halophilus]|uniref:TetR/AcrR family transcriptional regulator n=1 Tax=Celeribacter halophilus TaxID=576117 RepID=UPI003A93764C